MSSATLLDHCFAVLIGVIMPGYAILRARRGLGNTTFDTKAKISMYLGNSVLMAMLTGLVLYGWLAAGRSLGSLGFAWPMPATWRWGIAVAVAGVVAYAIDAWREVLPSRIARTRARWRRHTPFMPQTGTELRAFMVLATSAAICEETMFRGFLISYVAFFLGPSPAGLAAAVAIPAVVFAGAHCYQGARAVVKIIVGGIAFGAVYVLTESLWIPIAVHFAVDVVGGIVSVWLMRSDAGAAEGERAGA